MPEPPVLSVADQVIRIGTVDAGTELRSTFCAGATATGAIASPSATGPRERTSATAVPPATLVPAVGFWLMMLPAGTVAWFAVVIAPTVSVAPVMAVRAAVSVRPTTLGVVTAAGPRERTSVTAAPAAMLAPAAGFWLM